MNRHTPRIHDVARLAGVSAATVSRALSKPEVVSEATLEAVRAAVRATGYTVNQAARNLRQQRTGSVVALVPNLANPFFSRILAGIAGVLAEAGYGLLVADTKGPGGERTILAGLNRGRADGLIVLDGTIPADELAPEGRGAALPPVVLACEWIDALAAPSIRVDNAGGARLAVAHLAGLGHRRIGHLLGPAENVLTAARAGGTREALAAAGLRVEPAWFFAGDFSLASGQRAAAAWMGMADRPTAVFCSSDEMACGFIGEVQRRGLAVPRDVSVIGFDDVELVAHITPALTTVRQPRGAIGATAAQAILDLIAGGSVPADALLPVELVVRDSTAPPPG